MEIKKNINDIDAEYDFYVDSQIIRQERNYTIYGLDPIRNKNKVVIGEIILRGYSTKLNEIEEKLLKIFE